MNESEVNLVREYVIVFYLIEEALIELEKLKTSRISLSGILVFATKSMGARLKDKLKRVQKDLRASGIYVRIEDDGEEVLYVCTAKNGVKGRHGIKRRILREDMEAKLMEYANEFMHEDFIPHKIESGPDKDPYAKVTPRSV